MVLKELFFNNSTWKGSEKNCFLTVLTLGGCGGPERTDFHGF